jgi:ATP-binding cassette subfamily B protein
LAFAFSLLRQEASRSLKALMGLALSLVLMLSALGALMPVLLKFIVDYLAAPHSSVYLPVGLLVVGYACSHLLARLFGELRTLAIGRADQRLHRRLSLRLFRHVMALPLRFHLDKKTGALNQTLTNGLLGYRILIHHLALTVLPVIVELAVISAVLLALGQPVFLGIIGASLVCYTASFSVGAVRLTGPARLVSTSHIDANALLTDSIMNYETIKSFCAEPHMHERMQDAFTRTETYWLRFFSVRALNGVIEGTIFAVSIGTSMYVGAQLVEQDDMSIGDFVLVNAYMLQIFRPIEMLGLAVRDVSQGIAFIEKMIDVFRQLPERALRADGRSLPPGRGELVFEAVSLSYSPGRPILQDLSFTVPAGATVAIVGASGSGKSSLVRLLMRFWEPDSGRILIDGMSIAETSALTLRRAIGVVPQDTVLFNDTIGFNIAVGRADGSGSEVVQAARIANIHDFIIARPQGYGTLVGERGLKLSGGEKQRIAIARAALRTPRIFVFDEATSSLDSKTERRILHKLTEISRGTTTIVIAHRLSTITDVDHILVLESGRIIEQGTHSDLLQYGGVYLAMWAAQNQGSGGQEGIAR